MEFASKAVGTAGLTTGIIGTVGTAASLLGGGLGNILGNMNGRCATVECSDNVCVNRYELNMAQENTSLKSENALLRADKYTDQKIVEAYKDLQGQIKAVEDKVDANKDAQAAINMQQATYNATCNATINCMQQQINTLLGITKVVIPNTSVCPGWGNVNVTPATAATAG